MKGAAPRTYSVYVVELDPEVLKERKFVAANPDADPSKPCLYVGMTGLNPTERLENHRAGYKSNRFVHRYGKYLRRKMFEKFNPMTQSEAVEKEVELAESLRTKGYAVWQH